MYKFIADIDNGDKFRYAGILLMIIYVSTRLKNYITVEGLVGLVIGIGFIYYLNDKIVNTGSNFIDSMEKIISSDIMKPKINTYLFHNSEIVIFLDKYREYYQYNPELWNNFVRSINNFLTISNDIKLGTVNYNYDYQNLHDIKKKIYNNYHSFIYTIPHSESSNNKYHIGMDKLQKILNKEVDKIHSIVAEKNSKNITTSTIFHYKNHPAPKEDYHTSENIYSFFN